MKQIIPEEVLKEVDAIIEEEHKDYPKGMGYCHAYWHRKKQLLAAKGYDWKSPQELNPGIIYD